VPLFLPYRAVLRTPHACGAFATSLAGRLCYGIVGLSLLLTLTAGGHDYGFAGLVMALFGVAIVLVSPFRAWVVDRHGPRRALPPMAAGFAAVLVAIAVIPARSGVNDAAIAVLAAAAGACAPPLGVVMRTLWSALIDDRDVLQTAYSLDGVVEELLNVTGPVIVGVIAVAATPAVGLLVAAGLVVAGTGLFVRSPALRRWPAQVARHSSRAPVQATGKAGAGRAIVAVAFVTGALGGLGYGAVAWRISAQRRLALLAIGLVVVLIPAALSPNLLVLALLIGLAGVLVSPALATAYVLADSLASAQARSRAGNWVNSGYTAGNSAGAVLSGQLVGRIPLSACLPVLAAPALLAVVPVLWIRLTSAAEQSAAPDGPAGDTVPSPAQAAGGDR
jgi:predicted MFS family arabinose efflux permease